MVAASMGKSSIEKAVEEIAIGSGMFGTETSAQQLDLLRDKSTGSLPTDIFPRLRRSGPGRPAGSVNKANRKIAQMICQKHGDPVLELASLGFMPLDQLVDAQWYAAGLGAMDVRLDKMIDRLEDQINNPKIASDVKEQLVELQEQVFKTIVKLSSKKADFARHALTTKKDSLVKASEYVHGKKPIAVDLTGRADVILNIPGLTDSAALAEYVDGGDLSSEQLEQAEFVHVDEEHDDVS